MAKDTKGDINLGKFGENLACGYLVENGFKILRRNERVGRDEIDIIARAKDRTLVFVEVKTFGDRGGSDVALVPEDNITKAKLVKLRRACAAFAAGHGELVDERRGWRIDVLAISIDITGKTSVRHYENV